MPRNGFKNTLFGGATKFLLEFAEAEDVFGPSYLSISESLQLPGMI